MTKKEAMQAAKALRKKMTGRNWKIRVWENLGWHYQVHRSRISVLEAIDGRGNRRYYTSCSMATDGIGTPVEWSVRKPSFTDPNQAVQAQLNAVRQDVFFRMRILMDEEEEQQQ
jgi:hypothetical protein